MLEAKMVTQCGFFFKITLQDIQHLPWESIPMLFDQPVTRVPSLQFLLSKVHGHVVDLLRSLLVQLDMCHV